MRLTEAGERLHEAARPALEELRAAEERVKELGDQPSGTLRLNVSRGAEGVLSGPLLAGFLTRCPRVRLELVVTEHTGDIVEAGYDAAVGLGEVIGQDMVALPVSDELRLTVVGSPSYFRRHPAPEHPRHLGRHVCINWTPTADGPPYRWEFTERGRDLAVSVDARILTTDPALNIRLAIAGVGLTIAYDRHVRDHIDAGELVPVLVDYCDPFPGFYLYFPRRRYRSAALGALIEYVRGRSGGTR